MPYLRNCWYMAAWSREIASGEVLARTLLDEPVVLFRDSTGAVGALLDRCPHRFAPLSRGKLVGDALQCPYHGLQFAKTGACAVNPHGPITSSMSVRSFPVLEKSRQIWIWMGEQSRADGSLLSEFSFIDDAPDSAFNSGYLLGNGNYQLFIDNLLDLTHIDYLHTTTLSTGRPVPPPEVTHPDPGHIVVRRQSLGVNPFAKVARFLPGIETIDDTSEMTWSAPSAMTHRRGHAPAGSPRENGLIIMNFHFLTPESETTTHYFFGDTRNFAIDDSEFNKEFGALKDHAFKTEDEPMIRYQQQRMNGADFWELKPVILKTDEGAVRARRALDKLIQLEQQGAREPSRRATA